MDIETTQIMGKKVLIVEDNDFLLSMFTAKLSKETDWTVLSATDGKEAISICEKEKPQLMFLDIILPYMNGFEVIKKIRSDESFDHMHIIVMSVLGQEQDVKQAKEFGADDYIIKSEMNMDEILRTALNILANNNET